MHIRQIRNATVRITYGGKTFLTDPWLMPKGAMGCFADTPFRPCRPEQESIPMPMCALPIPVEDVLRDVDAYVITHIHPDHVDMEPDGTLGRALDKHLPVFAQSPEDAYALVRSGFTDVTVLYENSMLGDIRLIKTPGRHGTRIPCGPSCGVIFQAAGEKTLYAAGDTIWYDGVKATLEHYSPDVIIVNACAAALAVEGRLIMDDADVAAVHKACPAAKIVVSHMDSVAHAAITRADMRLLLKKQGLETVAVMPDDGETLAF